jgi:ubiquinone/menaquinone biosynthesis C-methylase UbiE
MFERGHRHAKMPLKGQQMSKVLEANIEVHTKLADHYDSEEPHFRPENQEKVRRKLGALRKRAGGGRLLDIGCGTGFIIHNAIGIFDEIHGVDITPAMMSRVRTDLGRISLHLSPAEELPFEDGIFDAASAYSFIDHVQDTGRVFKEVARVLKTGGVFYLDLAPNKLFWEAVQSIAQPGGLAFDDIVNREIGMVTENDQKIERQFGIDASSFRAAEPGKERGGIDPVAIRESALSNGFSHCDIEFDWFLGQAAIMHGQSFEHAAIVDQYLKRAAPLTDRLYKYLTIYAEK